MYHIYHIYIYSSSNPCASPEAKETRQSSAVDHSSSTAQSDFSA